MFHIGIATQHPPLPDPNQMSELGIDFIEQCVTLDPTERPSAVELIQHPWLAPMVEAMVSFQSIQMFQLTTSHLIFKETAVIPTLAPVQAPARDPGEDTTVGDRRLWSTRWNHNIIIMKNMIRSIITRRIIKKTALVRGTMGMRFR